MRTLTSTFSGDFTFSMPARAVRRPRWLAPNSFCPYRRHPQIPTNFTGGGPASQLPATRHSPTPPDTRHALKPRRSRAISRCVHLRHIPSGQRQLQGGSALPSACIREGDDPATATLEVGPAVPACRLVCADAYGGVSVMSMIGFRSHSGPTVPAAAISVGPHPSPKT